MDAVPTDIFRMWKNWQSTNSQVNMRVNEDCLVDTSMTYVDITPWCLGNVSMLYDVIFPDIGTNKGTNKCALLYCHVFLAGDPPLCICRGKPRNVRYKNAYSPPTFPCTPRKLSLTLLAAITTDRPSLHYEKIIKVSLNGRGRAQREDEGL